ncbi:MAG: spinster family MFS transporter [Phenylobacterium sp.]
MATAGSKESIQTDCAAPTEEPYSKEYMRYALWLLLGLSIVNFIDRAIVSILAEPIKKELHLTDAQLGMVTGVGFAVVYVVFSLPIARLAERWNRPWLIAGLALIWGSFTSLCGSAQGFMQLVLFRTGVGFGESGFGPTAHSLISDYVPRAKRASALAFNAMGAPVGSLIGLVLGGLVADAFGWRAAFLLVGLPAVIFALLAFLTLREPRKLLAARAVQGPDTRATFVETLRYLAGKRAFWFVAVAAGTKTLINSGQAPFLVSFFLRNHGPEITQLSSGMGLKAIGFLGLAVGLLYGVPGAIGTYFGGWIADRLAVKDRRNILLTPAIASFLCVPLFAGVVLSQRIEVAFLFLALNFLVSSTWFGPTFSTAQSVVPPHMRATSSALLGLITTLVGTGIGPLAIGLLSDFGNHAMRLGPNEGLRWALLIISLFGAVAGTAYFLARQTLDRDMVS